MHLNVYDSNPTLLMSSFVPSCVWHLGMDGGLGAPGASPLHGAQAVWRPSSASGKLDGIAFVFDGC